ncbi:hypothetical protein J2S71_001932 [Olsenella profusa DSM 13989]|nr:hypothetical protein [Olsenella profusa]MDP9859214.1 hypothetical protein [Olsenella profusa DSM 13989]MDP9859352.1 hypothetical protein [Olsenella profusa DSM 13989]MDP9859846.1 hypothetical protein [Olsenella profusa DSM 13989]MDP9859971.1 hypothetical protein [Olsenella profusa DSM 13989]MDP9860236.1 hypothetical protein [Olsenella profusa DSM 13989]
MRTSPHTLLPTSVALSSTARAGTPPTNARTPASPSRTHSAASPQKTCVRPTSGCGKLTARQWPRVSAPLTPESAWPKSTWHSPASQSSCRKPWASLWSASRAISPRRLLTYLCTVEYDPS